MSARPPSLLANIARGLVVVSLLAIATTAILLYAEFKSTDDRMRQRTLSGVSIMIEHFARAPDGRIGGALPEGALSMLRTNAVIFAVVDETIGF